MSKGLLAAARSWIVRSLSWQRIISAAVLLFSVGFLGYKAYTSWDALKTYEWQIRYIYLIPSFLLYLAQHTVIARAWGSIVNRLARPLPYGEHFLIYSYTQLMRRLPAGTLWILAGRAFAYREQDIPGRLLALGSFLEILFAILTGLPLAALAAAGLDLYPISVGLFLSGVALILELSLIHPVLLGKLVRRVRHEPLRAEITYRDTLAWMLLYTLIWLISGTGLYLIVRLFTNLPWAYLPRTIGVWVMSSLAAYLTLLSPSGLGVKELSLAFLLAIYLPEPLPLLIALAVRLVWTLYEILVGVAAYTYRVRYPALNPGAASSIAVSTHNMQWHEPQDTQHPDNPNG